MIRVVLPRHLLELAGIAGEVQVEPRAAKAKAKAMSTKDLLDAVEARYPVLRGTIRLHGSLERRAYVRFFACEQDLSHEPSDMPLPDAVLRGEEPFIVLGAMSGG